MNAANKNRVRLGVEGLEERQVMSASPGPAAVLAPPTLGQMAKVQPAAKMNVNLAAKQNVGLVQTLSAVRIYNRTGINRGFYIKWNNGPWTYYVLAPNQSRLITNVNAGFLPSKCRISFDRSSAAGYQERIYTLAVGYGVKTPFTNPIGLARNYAFKPAPGGRDLFVGSV